MAWLVKVLLGAPHWNRFALSSATRSSTTIDHVDKLTPHDLKTRKSYHVPGHFHEFTFSCYGRKPFLAEFDLYQVVCDSIDAARAKLNFQLVAYVLMPEHVHLLLLPPEDGDSASILYGIKRPVGLGAMKHIRKNFPHRLPEVQVKTPRGYESRLWQAGGGYDRNIFTKKALHTAIAYIHSNPAKRGLVSDVRDWRWSSLGEFEVEGSGPLRLDRIDGLV